MSQPKTPTTAAAPPKRRARWLIAVALIPAGWLAWSKATRVPSPRAVATEYRAGLGGASRGSELLFRDATQLLGIESVHDNDARGKYWLPEEMGPGVGLLDYDGDGDLDLFVAGGGSLTGERATQPCQLWRNDGGVFVEVAASVGAAVPGHAYGVACADVDADGDVDLYLTRLGSDVYLRNEGGRFVDATLEAGLGCEEFGASAAFFDYDGDGWLDLYVTNYVEWAAEKEQGCFLSGVPDYCDPTSYEAPAQDRLYRNLDGERFEDVTEAAGIQGHLGNGLGVLAQDFDGDGWTDLYVANDSTPAFLWHNRGDGTFEEAALRMGCAYDGAGVAIAGMGVACEDLNADGWADLLVTNIHDQSHLVLRGAGRQFVEATRTFGVQGWSMPSTGFGVAVFDQDHDGEWDLYVANGGVNLTPARIDDPDPYTETDQFARLVDGKFVDASEGAGVSEGGSGRGLAMGDLDQDGDIDLVVTNNGSRLQVLQNLHDGEGAWLMVDVRNAAGGPELGARIELRSGETTRTRTVRAQSSYLSSSDPRVHFGLGDVERVDELRVHFPGGSVQVLEDVEVDQVVEVRRE